MCSKTKKIIFVIVSLFFLIIALLFPYDVFINLVEGAVITCDEFNKLKKDAFVNGKIVSADNGESLFDEYVVNFNLFNLFNIKNLKVSVVNSNEVLLGGDCIGLNLKSKGVTVVGSNYIITKNGNISPIELSNLKIGDVITHLNGCEVNSLKDVQTVVDNCNGESINVIAVRKGDVINTVIKPEFDIQTKSYKLGIWIKEDATGVGTLTFVHPKSLRYASLGHAISDVDSGEKFQINGGEIYKCNVIGVKKGTKGLPGEILGYFMLGKNVQGNVDLNNENGVYGNLNKNSELSLGRAKIRTGGKLTAKPGKAKILTCINGTKVEEFDIELIKTNYQMGGSGKSMIIKVVDEDLIAKTGGIVQGMSGSPIIQDGKLVGAVTHVFVNDPTRGFGLYLDWMINE